MHLQVARNLPNQYYIQTENWSKNGASLLNCHTGLVCTFFLYTLVSIASIVSQLGLAVLRSTSASSVHFCRLVIWEELVNGILYSISPLVSAALKTVASATSAPFFAMAVLGAATSLALTLMNPKKEAAPPLPATVDDTAKAQSPDNDDDYDRSYRRQLRQLMTEPAFFIYRICLALLGMATPVLYIWPVSATGLALTLMEPMKEAAPPLPLTVDDTTKAQSPDNDRSYKRQLWQLMTEPAFFIYRTCLLLLGIATPVLYIWPVAATLALTKILGYSDVTAAAFILATFSTNVVSKALPLVLPSGVGDKDFQVLIGFILLTFGAGLGLVVELAYGTTLCGVVIQGLLVLAGVGAVMPNCKAEALLSVPEEMNRTATSALKLVQLAMVAVMHGVSALIAGDDATNLMQNQSAFLLATNVLGLAFCVIVKCLKRGTGYTAIP